MVHPPRKQPTGHARQILSRLSNLARPANLAGMARFGINTRHALGVPMPALRKLAKEIGRNHALARGLRASGIHEARILAGLVGDTSVMTGSEMDRWARDFDSWDVCDQVCSNLFDKTPWAWTKAVEWSARDKEFVKRAGFVLMAALAVHDKAAPDAAFRKFLPIIRREARDDRNFVKKAVNWALRQIGKRNERLCREAIRTAESIRKLDSKSARWIAADALRELRAAKERGKRGRRSRITIKSRIRKPNTEH